jgi:hypothetical protein
MKAASNKVPELSWNGTNQYAIGIDGVNGFNKNLFSQKTGFTFNIVLRTSFIINEATIGARLCELSSPDRTQFHFCNIGQVSSSIANEYIGFGKFVNSSPNLWVQNDQKSINSTTYTMLTYSMDAFGSTRRILVNGINIGGTVVNVPSEVDNVDRVSLFGTVNGVSLFSGVTRECFFMRRLITDAEGKSIFNHYFGKSKSLISSHSLYNDTHFIDAYSMKKSGNILLASKSASHNLTIVNP